jgi:hypothetical protein
MNGYDALLARREVEDSVADVFEAEFLVVTGRSVEIVGRGESPDYEVLIDDVKTGLELTAIMPVMQKQSWLKCDHLQAKRVRAIGDGAYSFDR